MRAFPPGSGELEIQRQDLLEDALDNSDEDLAQLRDRLFGVMGVMGGRGVGSSCMVPDHLGTMVGNPIIK